MFLPSRARLTSRCPLTPHARNLENPVVPTLLARGSRHAFLVQCVEGGAVPAACGNKILTIFAPYTFSHSQGHIRAWKEASGHVSSSSESRRNCCAAQVFGSLPANGREQVSKPLTGAIHSMISSARATSAGGKSRP